MADQNANDTAQGTQANDQAQDTADEAVKLYATRADAEANPPATKTKSHRVFTVLKDEKEVGALWARGYDNAGALMAKSLGYTFSLGKAPPAPTQAQLTAALATLDDATLAQLGLTRAPATTTPATQPAPTPATGTTPAKPTRGRKQ